MKNIFILLFVLLCSMQVMAKQTQLVVHMMDETLQIQSVALIGKWMFVDNQVQLISHDGSLLVQEPIESIRKITYVVSNEPDAVENVMGEDIVVYPNPTHDVLMIRGIEVQTLRVFDMQGQLLQMTEGTQVNVSELSVGSYLLQVGTQVVKFTKQ